MISELTLALPVLFALSNGISAAVIQSRAEGINPSDFKSEGLVAIGGLVPGKYSRNGNTYSGQFYLQPDRGYNVETTIDYVARHHTFDFQLEEYTGTANLAFSQASKLFNITYCDTLYYHEAASNKGNANIRNTTGLDPTAVRTGGLSGNVQKDSPLAEAKGMLSLDTEGFSANPDGTFWVSEEYTPGIYKIASDGSIIAYITLPRLSFPVSVASTTSPPRLIPILEEAPMQASRAATAQDGGDGAPYVRIFEWDISSLAGVTSYRPGDNPGRKVKLVGKYAFKVPTSKKGKGRNVSDLIYLGHKTVGLLVRDGNGFGNSDTDVSYKHIDILDLSTATNLAGTKYDDATGAIAPGRALASDIDLAAYSTLIDYTSDLPKFGMHSSGKPVDPTLLAAKIESLILLPTLPKSDDDKDFDKDEFFIVSVSDNDFQTKTGYMRAIGDYSAAYPQDVPTQLFVFKVKLPDVNRSDLVARLGLSK